MRPIKREDVVRLEDLPNVGKSTAADLRLLGFEKPEQLHNQDPFSMYAELSRRTGVRQDPCVLDVFISVVRFMDGAEPLPWWNYTAERKKLVGEKI